MNSQIGVALAVVLSVCVALFMGLAIAEESFLVVAVVCLVLAGMFFIIQPSLLAASVVILVSSGLTLPQLQGKLNLFHLAALMLVGFVVIRYAFDQSQRITFSTAHGWLLCFGSVILATMFFRGAGLRVLGDEKWGGMFYVQLFICMSLIFVLPRVTLPPGMWRPTLVLSGMMTFLPVVAGLAAMGGASAILMFIQADAQTSEQATQLGVENTSYVTRYFALGPASFALFTILLYFVPVKDFFGKRAVVVIPVVAICLAMAGLSGFRSSLLNIVLTTIVVFWLTKSFSPGRCFVALGVAGIFYAIALSFSTSFPLPVQRMLSILPGVTVDSVAEQDATSTAAWRLNLWQRGIESIPDYWLVGKGYAFSSSEMFAAHDPRLGLFDPTDWAVVTSAYHQGLLSLVIGLGVMGLITGMATYFLFVKRHMKFLKDDWVSEPLRVCHLVTTAVFLADFVRFILIYGDVQVSFPRVFILVAILEAMWATNLAYRARHEESEKPELLLTPNSVATAPLL